MEVAKIKDWNEAIKNCKILVEIFNISSSKDVDLNNASRCTTNAKNTI
jgi:hypothetical protein